ncbi:iron complex transport system substrate-binding protein [Aequitasia blattaphilus]|uniref:ABC transporter substrate-binding protein n=1 Tax=Aequitasia blattaphilus TaxID=2949332 RepID=A0ABT1E7L9_9FIRM|nr:ABC transporter substrate-binding protein [Aequitasia blattaphilus]MCP1101809.1 ABC transporter substrate-binding protein [Aequitasia blattaphilus]MCR8614449.1 ABC transporter substrate-binding protein [Aequitasia blattaphilus]
MKIKQALSIFIVFTMLALSACSHSEKVSTGVTVTDQADRKVIIGENVEEIVNCYYISTSTCIALGLTNRMTAVESNADIRPIYRLAAPELLDLPAVGSPKEFNLEACIDLNPDLIILPKRLQDSADTLTDLGIPVILVNPESHEELIEMISLIGDATSTQDAANHLVEYYNKEWKEIQDLTKNLQTTPSVYMGGNSSYLTTAPKDMYQSSIIGDAGGVNVGDAIDGTSWAEVSYEQILEMNPEFFIIPSNASYRKEDIMNDPHLANISAITSKRVYQMPNDFESWDSPIPSGILGVKWLLSVLHEELYSLDDLRQNAADFYKEFYNLTIDTTLIAR